MKTYIVARIHNNSLGKVIYAENEEEAKDILRDWAEEHFGRPLEPEEVDDLNDFSEITDCSDPDNITTFSVGIVE